MFDTLSNPPMGTIYEIPYLFRPIGGLVGGQNLYLLLSYLRLGLLCAITLLVKDIPAWLKDPLGLANFVWNMLLSVVSGALLLGVMIAFFEYGFPNSYFTLHAQPELFRCWACPAFSTIAFCDRFPLELYHTVFGTYVLVPLLRVTLWVVETTFVIVRVYFLQPVER